MSILSAQSIIDLQKERPTFIEPFMNYEARLHGVSHGLSPAGYCIRLDKAVSIAPMGTVLASTMERLDMPDNIKGRVVDKSTWARQFLSVFNTVIQPGWSGFLTLELVNHSNIRLEIPEYVGIAEIEFTWLDTATKLPYVGQYNHQPRGPQSSKWN